MNRIKALFGGPLSGSAPVRFIYTDEAGTSAREPVTVVAGLIVHADTQWLPAMKKVRECLATVPEPFREDFEFHATAVWGSKKYRPAWSFDDRVSFLKRMMSIPRETEIPIVISWMDRRTPVPEKSMSPEQYHHMMAFGHCMAYADGFIRENGSKEELATVVAEDIPEMRRRLRLAVLRLRLQPVPYDVEASSVRLSEFSTIKISEGPLKISRIIDTIHFAAKYEAPLLQLADACAFGVRRYLSGQRYGDVFAEAIVGADDLCGLKASPQGSTGLGIFHYP